MKRSLCIFAVLTLIIIILTGCSTPNTPQTSTHASMNNDASVSPTQSFSPDTSNNTTITTTQSPSATVTDTATPAQSDTSVSATVKPTATTAPTTTVSPTVTAKPTASPTAKPDRNKPILESFSSGSADKLVVSLDWSKTQYGFTNPELSLTDKGTEAGKGLKVTMPDKKAQCQNLNLEGSKVSDAFNSQREYFRLWINNCSDTQLSLAVVLIGDGYGAYAARNATLTSYTGTVTVLGTNDISKMGKGTHSSVEIPPYFKGWVAFDAQKTISYHDNPRLKDTTTVDKITIDVRSTPNEEASYVIDELGFYTSPSGKAQSFDLQNGLKGVSDVKASLVQVGKMNGPRNTWLQGGASDGKYYYQAFVNPHGDTELTTLAKFDIKANKILERLSDLELDHCNDITYNSKLKQFVVCHNTPNFSTVSFLDGTTLEVVATKKIGYEIFSIEYNQDKNQYVVGLSGSQSFRILDADFNPVAGPFQPTSKTEGCTNQCATTDGDYIYFLFYKPNLIAVYDWSGNFVSIIDIGINNDTMEPESMVFLNGKLYINFGTFYQLYTRLYVVDAIIK